MSVEERAPITPQQYEVLHGGGAAAAEIAKQRLSGRRFLRRSMLAVWGLSTTAAVAGALRGRAIHRPGRGDDPARGRMPDEDTPGFRRPGGPR